MQVSVAKNTATNYLVMLIRFFQGLLVTRWLIGYLGDSGYGLWMLLWTFFGYADGFRRWHSRTEIHLAGTF